MKSEPASGPGSVWARLISNTHKARDRHYLSSTKRIFPLKFPRRFFLGCGWNQYFYSLQLSVGKNFLQIYTVDRVVDYRKKNDYKLQRWNWISACRVVCVEFEMCGNSGYPHPRGIAFTSSLFFLYVLGSLVKISPWLCMGVTRPWHFVMLFRILKSGVVRYQSE